MMSIKFSSIGADLTVRVSVRDLSNRDKVELFRELMDQLGITERLSKEADATARAQQIIAEQWNIAWENLDGKPQT